MTVCVLPTCPELSLETSCKIHLDQSMSTSSLLAVFVVFFQVCLRLMKGSEGHQTMCDTSEGFLVTSGSAVLNLEVGDTVSLEATRYNSIVTSQSSTSHIFTGFLIFPTA